ncbi:MAG: hypothetical protein ACE5JE_05085 [Thermoplasmata archaeon]
MAVGVGAYLALASAIVAGIFAALVFRQYATKRRVFQLVWGVGLALFTLASALEFVSELAGGWGPTLYRTYFSLHPTLVAVLGLGTVYLLADKRVGHGFLVYILVFFGILLFFTATATLAVSAADPNRILCPADTDPLPCEPGRVVGASAMPDAVRNLSLLFTIPGSAALIGGALYSWYRTRGSYNLLIAAGAGLMATGGTLTRLGQAELLYIFLLGGIAILFVGFLRSLEVSRAPTQQATPASAQ